MACEGLTRGEIHGFERTARAPEAETPEEKWQAFLEVTSKEITQADAARKYRVDVSTIMSRGVLRQPARRRPLLMDRATFDRIVAETREAHPRWLSLDSDQPPTSEAIDEARRQLGAALSKEYVDFLRRYGGGDFAFTVVYSLDPTNDLNLIVKNGMPWLTRNDFIAFSDNGAGDSYGFLVDDGHAGSAVYLLDHESGELRPTGHADLYDFLIEVGLRPSQDVSSWARSLLL